MFKLEQKYFIPFIATIAVVVLGLIIYVTFSYRAQRVDYFKEEIAERDSLAYVALPRFTDSTEDSVMIADFAGSYVILNFWASWSELAERMHTRLDEVRLEDGNQLVIVAAAVKDGDSKIEAYIKDHPFEFVYVEGTELYNDLKIPGVPSNIIFNPQGKVADLQIGYDDSLKLESLPLAPALEAR